MKLTRVVDDIREKVLQIFSKGYSNVQRPLSWSNSFSAHLRVLRIGLRDRHCQTSETRIWAAPSPQVRQGTSSGPRPTRITNIHTQRLFQSHHTHLLISPFFLDTALGMQTIIACPVQHWTVLITDHFHCILMHTHCTLTTYSHMILVRGAGQSRGQFQ